MGTEMLQHVTVTLVAFGALVVIARRALGFVLARPAQRGCSNCASSNSACATSSSQAPGPTAHPVVLMRSSAR